MIKSQNMVKTQKISEPFSREQRGIRMVPKSSTRCDSKYFLYWHEMSLMSVGSNRFEFWKKFENLKTKEKNKTISAPFDRNKQPNEPIVD